MRISADKDDPGYANYAPGAKVYLNGELRPGVFTADEEQGLIYGAPLDEHGKPILRVDRALGTVIRTAMFGEVRIELTDVQRERLSRLGRL